MAAHSQPVAAAWRNISKELRGPPVLVTSRSTAPSLSMSPHASPRPTWPGRRKQGWPPPPPGETSRKMPCVIGKKLVR